MKKCGRCKEIKSEDLFFKNKSRNDGLSGWCKDCNKQYYETESGKLTRKRWSHSAKKKQHDRNYSKTDSFKFRHYKRTVEDRKRNPEKWKARRAVNRAVRSGILPLVESVLCKFDGCENFAQEYHHPDYNKSEWLNVIPYCSSHHKRIHEMMIDGGGR